MTFKRILKNLHDQKRNAEDNIKHIEEKMKVFPELLEKEVIRARELQRAIEILEGAAEDEEV